MRPHGYCFQSIVFYPRIILLLGRVVDHQNKILKNVNCVSHRVLIDVVTGETYDKPRP